MFEPSWKVSTSNKIIEPNHASKLVSEILKMDRHELHLRNNHLKIIKNLTNAALWLFHYEKENLLDILSKMTHLVYNHSITMTAGVLIRVPTRWLLMVVSY